jgi:hypothetical protein
MKLEVEIYLKRPTIILKNQLCQMKLKSLTGYPAVTGERPSITGTMTEEANRSARLLT